MSICGLAERWKWSRNKVKRFLCDLETMHQVDHQNSNVTTLITLRNYDLYQEKGAANESTDDTASESASESANGPLSRSKEVKKKENYSLSQVAVDEKRTEKKPNKVPPGLKNQTEWGKCISAAEYLRDIVTEKKSIKVDGQKLRAWANNIRLLVVRDGISFERLKAALVWLKRNYDEQYTPVVESGKTLRDKFLSIEYQMKKNGVIEPDGPKSQISREQFEQIKKQAAEKIGEGGTGADV